MSDKTQPALWGSLKKYIADVIKAFQANIFDPAIAYLQSQISGLTPNTSEAGITASGTTQANATSITKTNTRFDTVAANKTARIDIAATVGAKATVQNWGANDLSVYASTSVVGNTFNVNGTPQVNGTPYTLGAGNQLTVFCYVIGEWSTQ